MAEALSPSDLDALRQALRTLEAELKAVLTESAEAARPVELDQPAIGRVSRIDAIQQQKMLEANRASQKGRLGLIRTALARIEAGEYGECQSCGEEVGIARLTARPESAFCIECQQSRERR
ncbi:MAG: TraR/DksA family transcriptional regulator [Myxococcota bacterium]